jgi:hypothetical protein
MRKYLIPILLILASLACNLPGAAPSAQAIPTIDIPTFTPTAPIPEKPTDLPAPPIFSTPELPAPAPVVPRFDPRSIANCDIFLLDADFANTVGSIPDTKLSLSDAGKQYCQYNFGNSTLDIFIATDTPGKVAFENARQFDAPGATVTPYPIGDMAVIKNFGDGRISLEAVLNGWYVLLDGNGLDEKHLVLLAELLLAKLSPYTP